MAYYIIEYTTTTGEDLANAKLHGPFRSMEAAEMRISSEVAAAAAESMGDLTPGENSPNGWGNYRILRDVELVCYVPVVRITAKKLPAYDAAVKQEAD